MLLTKGFDYIAQANTQGRTLSRLDTLPFGWQSPRSMRFTVSVTF